MDQSIYSHIDNFREPRNLCHIGNNNHGLKVRAHLVDTTASERHLCVGVGGNLGSNDKRVTTCPSNSSFPMKNMHAQ